MNEIDMIFLDTKLTDDDIFEFFAIYNVVPDLQFYYDKIDCRMITHYDFIIDDIVYTAICDDEGLLVDEPRFSLFKDYKPLLAGNIFITRFNNQGENIGLSMEDITLLSDHLTMINVYTHCDQYISYQLNN